MSSPLQLFTGACVSGYAGTNLGDPIELAAATAVLISESNPEGNAAPLSLAAGKSSIGHTEPAAGLAGVFHALHSMQACITQPILHFRQVSQIVLFMPCQYMSLCTFTCICGA